MKFSSHIITLSFVILSCSIACSQQGEQTQASVEAISVREAQILFGKQCAVCHAGNGAGNSPSLVHLNSMTPRSIVSSLETGKMQIQGQALSKAQKIGIAQMLTSREYSEESTPLVRCEEAELAFENVKYEGWAGDRQGTGYIPPEVAKLEKSEVPQLKLKWSFGFEGGTITRAKPTLIDESIIFGSQFGQVYCLDMYTGCVQWIYQAEAMVRGGIATSEDMGDQIRLYFADFNGMTYCLEANTGKLIWKAPSKTESSNAVTGTVAYYDGLVYVPHSSMEVVIAQDPRYECCKGSGMVVALDAQEGKIVWQHRVVQDTAVEQGVTSTGTKRFGPSGAPVWSSPTIDAKRGLLYIGTGENNSHPTTDNSDAIQALNLKTGELVWNYQATGEDAYIQPPYVGVNEQLCPNCPDPNGPDLDFGMSPVIVQHPDGGEMLVVGQKSGVVHCLNPDTGQPIWQKRLGRGGALGGIHWGIATDGRVAYVPNSDWWHGGSNPNYEAKPGLFAMDVLTGDILWTSMVDPNLCNNAPGCYTGFSAAPTLIEGVVFTGNLDGYARAHDTETGTVIWEYDTKQKFETINNIPARGGAIDGPGPLVANGMVFFNSGYGLHSQMPGNVFLAFGVE